MFIEFGTKDEEVKKYNNKFKKINFLFVAEGQPAVVRMLQRGSYKVYTHYINGATVACLGEDCPICANNKRLIVENPEDFRNSSGWSSASKKYFTNVLDRTMVKVCPNPECQAENRKVNNKWMPTCYACDGFITEVKETPSNKVKVFSYGSYVKDDLDALAVHPVTGDPVDLLAFDLALVASGLKKEKRIKAQALKDQNDKVEVPEDALYELESAVIHLDANELLQLHRGVSLKDIFNARKAGKETDLKENAELKSISEDTKTELQRKIAEMFPN